MKYTPLLLFKCLSDETRLLMLLLIHKEFELCVCELMHALSVNQSKISRHLAQLRQSGLLQDRREGQWVYYRMNPDLPAWAKDIISVTAASNPDTILLVSKALSEMGDRPQRKNQCCKPIDQ